MMHLLTSPTFIYLGYTLAQNSLIFDIGCFLFQHNKKKVNIQQEKSTYKDAKKVHVKNMCDL